MILGCLGGVAGMNNGEGGMKIYAGLLVCACSIKGKGTLKEVIDAVYHVGDGRGDVW